MEGSILESIGVEIIDVMSPVSICMLLVVLLVYTLSSSSPSAVASAQIRTAANLVYLENPSDTTSEKIEGALLNAVVFVILITVVTFLIVLLYYYNFTNFLKNYMRFSAFFVLGTMGGSIFLSVIQHFSIPIDSITCFLLLFNFTVVGVLSVFSGGIPILVRQGYMVSLGIIVAAWFTQLPEWTTWTLLIALALYDLVAVLAPGGPLKMLVELASSRDDELPALVYEARPTVQRSAGGRGGSALGLLVGGVSDSGSVELQAVTRNNDDQTQVREDNLEQTAINVSDFNRSDEIEISREDEETSLLIPNLRGSELPSSDALDSNRQFGHGQSEIVAEEERSPLVEMLGWRNEREPTVIGGGGGGGGGGGDGGSGEEDSVIASRGIKLGLGDFVFYSVLVGRAAMYDLMTVYACYLAIISGLGCTLILLAVCRHALPALPISILLGIMFYFLTRLLMEPFVVGTSTNLMMF